MARSDKYARMASHEEAVIHRAVTQERQRREKMDAATTGAGVGQVPQPRRITDTLLAAGDPTVVARTRAMGPYLTDSERDQVNRRSVAGGGQPIFPTVQPTPAPTIIPAGAPGASPEPTAGGSY